MICYEKLPSGSKNKNSAHGMSNTLTLDGKIISGQGNGKKYLALPWVKQQIEEKLGFTPYLGTLNLKLSGESVKHRKLLETTGAKIRPAEGYCIGLLFRAAIGETECSIVIPQIEDYPKNLLEIIAAVDLREFLHLNDGDAVAVTVYF